jgi:hypothetical protein
VHSGDCFVEAASMGGKVGLILHLQRVVKDTVVFIRMPCGDASRIVDPE